MGSNRNHSPINGRPPAKGPAAGLIQVVPFLVKDMLQQNGGGYSKARDWQP